MYLFPLRSFLLICLLGLCTIPVRGAVDSPGNLILGLRTKDKADNFLLDLGLSSKLTNGFSIDLSSSANIASVWGANWSANPDIFWNVVGSFHNLTLTEDESAYVDPNAGKFFIGNIVNQPHEPNGISTEKLFSLAGLVADVVNATTDATKTTIRGSQLIYSTYSDKSWGSYQNSSWNGFIPGRSEFSIIDIPSLSLSSYFYDESFNQTPPATLGALSFSNGIISFSSISGGPGGDNGSYTGPWNWTAGSGDWDVSNNWSNNQVASNGFAVGITGAAGGTITNNAVTNLSSLTFSNTAGSYTLSGTNAGQSLTISGGITNFSSNTQTFDLSIAGPGGVTQSGTGTMVLVRSNSYVGGTTLSRGAVVIGNNNALGSGTVTVAGDSSLIAGTANLSTTNAMAINAATTIDTAANRWTNAGTLSGSGSLTKAGSGTLTLSGTSASYSGASSINAGSMQVTGNLGTGTVTVNNGVSLLGTGTVGGVLVQSNGILTGGVDGAVGKLTVGGGMTFSAGSILNWKLANASSTNAGSAFDSFDVRGTLDLTGLTTGSTLQFNILNAVGGTMGFLNNQNSQWLVAAANSITGFSTNDFTISTAGFTNALGGGAFGFITNATGLYLQFKALGVDPWTGNIAAGSNVISGQTNTSTNNAVIGANSSRNGSVSVTNNGVWNVQGTLQVGGSTNGSGTLTIGSGGRIEANGLNISDQKGSRGLVLITNGASSNAISLGSGTVSFGSGNGTLQFAHTNAVTISNAISGRGTISSTGTGTTTLSGNQSAFTGTNSLSSGKMVIASGMTNGGLVNIAGKNASFNLNTNAVLASTGTHAVAGLLLDNSGMAFKDSIKGSVALSSTGVLQKTYATNQSVAGFGAGIGAGKSFSILAGTASDNWVTNRVTNNSSVTTNVVNAPVLQAKIVNGQLDFHGTTTNAIVMSMKDPSYSTIRNQIQWYNTNSGTWMNTIAGNSNNVTIATISGMNGKSFVGSFDSFLLSVNTNSAIIGTGLKLVDRQDQGVVGSLLDELNLRGAGINTYLANIMGAFGYNNATKTSWAVINHNSIFGDGSATFTSTDLLNEPVVADLSVFNSAPPAVQAVPESGTWALMVLGGGVLFLAAKRRKNQS